MPYGLNRLAERNQSQPDWLRRTRWESTKATAQLTFWVVPSTKDWYLKMIGWGVLQHVMYFVCSPRFDECVRFVGRTSIESSFHRLFIPFLSFFKSYQARVFAQDVDDSDTTGFFRTAHAWNTGNVLQKKTRARNLLKYCYAQAI